MLKRDFLRKTAQEAITEAPITVLLGARQVGKTTLARQIADGRRIGVEFKCADAPTITKSIHVALQDLKLDRLLVVYPGRESSPIHPKPPRCRWQTRYGRSAGRGNDDSAGVSGDVCVGSDWIRRRLVMGHRTLVSKVSGLIERGRDPEINCLRRN